MVKYGRVSERGSLWFIPAVFSYTGQTHSESKAFVLEGASKAQANSANRLRRGSEKLED